MRKTKAMWEAEIIAARQAGIAIGREEGRRQAYDHHAGEIQKSKLELLRGIGQTIQACASLADNVGGLR